MDPYVQWSEIFGTGEGYPEEMSENPYFDWQAVAIDRIRANPGGATGPGASDFYRQYADEGANPMGRTATNRALGIADSATRASLRSEGFGNNTPEDCGCKGTQSDFCAPGNSRTTLLYPATRVPKLFQATHQRVRGWHNVYIESTIVAQFSRKQSANAFCRGWNDMMKHLGSAASFDIPTLTFMFNSVIDGGSGAWGLKNGFDPPMHGVGGTVPAEVPV